VKKTIISHFYNEEYLLPWWLSHHKKHFDYGIMIDYNSTDKSKEIIEEICPHWKIVKTKNEYFDSDIIDREVEEYEKKIDGWRICLNTTEFLVGDYSVLDKSLKKQLYLGNLVFVEDKITSLNKNIPIFYQVSNAYNQVNDASGILHTGSRSFRSIHNYPIKYSNNGGRHFSGPISTNDLRIFYYGYLISIEEIILRKLQIQSKISDIEYNRYKHLNHPNITNREDFLNKIKRYQLPNCIDMSNEINRLVELDNLKENYCEKNFDLTFLQ
jgi:hypothetical protein